MTEILDTLGLVETRTIASGARLLDIMLKRGEVDLLQAGAICSGRFLIRVTGARDAVKAAVTAVVEDPAAVDTFIISRISARVIRALKTRTMPEPGQALGLVESRRSASGIAAADAAVKRADVTLVRLAVARGINGKSFILVAGNLAAVAEAVEAACLHLDKDLLDSTVIPNPDRRAAEALAGTI
ncbi:MAG: BMC domain-containing protein [Desulfobacter sp.]|nr:MAG: BMC domain-containing protein [Desulfobacter sp.]